MLKPDTIFVICAIVLSLLLLIAAVIYNRIRDYRELKSENPDPDYAVYQFNL